MQAPGLGGKIGYGIGDFGLNLYWQSILVFIVFFHVDVLGLSAWTAGVCFFIAGLWDAAMDPLMGMLSDRARSRWGQYRPFILLGAVPLAGAFTLCFSPPGWLVMGSTAMVAFALGSHMLLRTAYSVVSIPYSSLTAAITSDTEARASLTGWRMLFAFAGCTAVTALLPSLAAWFGQDGGNGYGPAAAIVGGLSVVALTICGLSVREQERPAVINPPMERRGGNGFWASIGRNGPLLRLMAATLVMQLGMGVLLRNLPYLMKYDLGDAALSGTALPWLTLLGVASVPIWVTVAKRWNKRILWQWGSAVAAMGALGLMLERGLWPTLICIGLVFIGHSAHGVATWSMLPDTVDYGQWQSGRRDEAKIYGIASCVLKLSLGASGIVAGWALDLVGFVPNADQGPETLTQFRLLAGLLPAAGLAASAALIWRYPLDAQSHRQILGRLAARA
jgi:GPH family glycoside/pentoside/hexuronide:cation symporter